MCGRFPFDPPQELYDRSQIDNRLDPLVPRYNIAPGQMVPVVIAGRSRRMVLMRWGLTPHWAKDARGGYHMIDARMETLSQKLIFRGLLSTRRCLVPASGFYEWKPEGRSKTPYDIHPAAGSWAAFAGLYDMWTNTEGQ